MKILILGNGFDLAHGLPTKYKDFLEFVNRIKILSQQRKKKYARFWEEHLKDWNVNEEVKSYIGNIIKHRGNSEVVKELYSLVKNNFWLDYFNKNKQFIDQGWIDFEEEISKKIQYIDYLWENNLSEETQYKGRKVTLKNEYIIFYEYVASFDRGNLCTEEDIEYIRDKLGNDLKRMVRCLEIYLSDCVERIAIEKRLPDINKEHFDRVLSFNYTDTYKNLYAPYDRNIEYDFIHGKANISKNIESNNMVLGIDEYLDSDKENKNVNFISFKKYFQRIHKETGSKYKNWIEQIQKDAGEIHEIFILGHSLDITDGDVIRELILNSNVKTTIFYHDKKTYGSQIANLVKVISKDELIRKVYGENKQIIFKKQKSSTKSSAARFEIQKDIIELREIHLLSDEKIKSLFARIEKMIKKHNTTYFSDIKNMVVLYSELVKLSIFETVDRETCFIEIAKKILRKDRFELVDTDYYKSLCEFCDANVEAFLEEIKKLRYSICYSHDEYEIILEERNIEKLHLLVRNYKVEDATLLKQIIDIVLEESRNKDNSIKQLYADILQLLSYVNFTIVQECFEDWIINEKDQIKKVRLQYMYTHYTNSKKT